MIRPLVDDFENFIGDRINAAEDRLNANEAFRIQRLTLQNNIEALSSSLNPQQADKFFAIDEQRAVILSISECNAYCSGFNDGLRIVATIL